MDNKNQSRNIDPQKIRAENLNGRFALVGLVALVGAYITTGPVSYTHLTLPTSYAV